MQGISGKLFVSYAHPDEPLMLVFRKHLRGMLADTIDVWSDHDISKGETWHSLLQGSLDQANSALLLVSPDYLVSSWCRTEMRQLAEAKRGGRLRHLFWVQLNPCGWRHSELHDFQGFASEQAITEFADETGRQRAILQACERIATELVRSSTENDRKLTYVRRLLSDCPGKHLTVDRVIHSSEFSIICHGFNGSSNIAVKVLKFSPLKHLMESLKGIGQRRMKLTDPSFIRIQDIFQSGGSEELRTIFVSEYIDDIGTLSKAFKGASEGEDLFSVDNVGRMLRRMARGLWEMHNSETPEFEWGNTLGLLTPENVYYNRRAVRLTVAPIGISSFLWHVLDNKEFVECVDKKSEDYLAPEQRDTPRGGVTTLTDQYMLGRLGLEMLERRELKDILNGSSVDKFWQEPEQFIGGRWKGHHQQLWRILKQLLQRTPGKRYEDMGAVIRELEGLEDEARALAKSVYIAPPGIENPPVLGEAFYKDFYETFFSASPESELKFKDFSGKKQHDKLKNAMAAVLNFHHGNAPTSLDELIKRHKGLNISRLEFIEFHKSFLETLAKHVEDGAVREAWKKLLQPAIDHMISECTCEPEKSGAPSEAAGESDRGPSASS